MKSALTVKIQSPPNYSQTAEGLGFDLDQCGPGMKMSSS